MRKITRWLTVLGLTVALVGCGSAMAAEESVIRVQLDGRELTFTDAVPQVQSERTFLPFRAVFEALGAQVDWDADTGAISAARDGRTVTMLPGSTEASVEDGGVTTAIQMGVAPYAAADEAGVWRTYVPVRFAAQAFGCAVGWDQGASTVLLVDADRLLKEAMEGKSYTYLDKLCAYGEKYNEGIWNAEFTMDGSMTMLGAVMPLNAAADMIMEGGAKVEMDMNMKLDMTQLGALVSAMSQTPLEAEDQAMFELMKNEGFRIAARGDLAQGKLYMNMSGKLFEEAFAGELTPEEKAEMPFEMKDLWFSMDMADLAEESGMDWVGLMKAFKSVAGEDYAREYARLFLAGLTLNAASNEGEGISYEVYRDSVESLALAFSDEGFSKEGDIYTAFVDGGLQKMELSLTMDKETVTGYGMVLNNQVSQQGMVMGMIIDTAVTGDEMTAVITVDAAGLISAELTMEGSYAPGETAPATQPPEGATVLDLTQMVNTPGVGELSLSAEE